MPNYVYVAAQDDNQIAVFTINWLRVLQLLPTSCSI
jgi:hypothetical protein